MNYIITRGYIANTIITRGYGSSSFAIVMSIIGDLIFRRTTISQVFSRATVDKVFKRDAIDEDN